MKGKIKIKRLKGTNDSTLFGGEIIGVKKSTLLGKNKDGVLELCELRAAIEADMYVKKIRWRSDFARTEGH